MLVVKGTARLPAKRGLKTHCFAISARGLRSMVGAADGDGLGGFAGGADDDGDFYGALTAGVEPHGTGDDEGGEFGWSGLRGGDSGRSPGSARGWRRCRRA